MRRLQRRYYDRIRKLATISKVAYNDSISDFCKHNGFWRLHRVLDEDTDTQAIILENDYEKIIAFRGTEWKLEDIKTDVKIKKIKHKITGNHYVHTGFVMALKSIKDCLDNEYFVSKPVVLIGHSLGGALAEIEAIRVRKINNISLITFGAPRTTDGFYSGLLPNIDAIRVVNPGDPVPLVPPLLSGYRHIFPATYIINNWRDLIRSFNLRQGAKAVATAIGEKHGIDSYIAKLSL